MAPSRQKVVLIILSVVLFFGASVMLFALKRIPLPERLVLAVADYGTAAALLLFLRQRYSGVGKDK